ncbi:MAG: M28 family peptidase [Planctomycetota bacterium]|nr:M28 family peptidase [Planctomycetota bacterium]
MFHQDRLDSVSRCTTWLLASGLLMVSVACQSTRLAPQGTPSPPAGSLSENLESHVRFLASDALRGRDTGTQESLRAAGYLAEVLRKAGAEPAGDGGGWYQVMDLQGVDLTRPPKLTLAGEAAESLECVHGADYRLMSGIGGVQNATLVTMNDPSVLPEVHGSGPVALFIDLDDPAAGFRLARDRRDELAAIADIVLFAGRPGVGKTRPLPEHLVGRPEAPASIMLNGPALERVRSGELDRVSFELAGEEPVAALNVVGKIPGVGTPDRPDLADEVVVLTAHYDHVGVSPDKSAEDRIFNGANDDASGVAVVLELARLFGEGEAPARTLVFALVTAEEQGLLGSTYFVQNPPVPLEDIVCNVNFEMLGQPDEGAGGFGKMFLTGFERSNLGPSWAAMELPIQADPYPQLQLFFRSDNLAFVRQGIPGHSISTGGMVEHYHEVTDETDTLNWPHMEICAEVSYQALVPVVSGALDPAWLPGGNPNSE